MKEGLVKLTGEKDLFYDSIEKKYRVRNYCCVCKNIARCKCFNTLEIAKEFIESNFMMVCSSRCQIAYCYELQDIYKVGYAMKEMGLIWKLKWYWFKTVRYAVEKWNWLSFIKCISEKDASKVSLEMDFDYDDESEGDERCFLNKNDMYRFC